MFGIGVRGPGIWFAYLGSGVLGGTVWGVGVQFEVGVSIARD